VAPVKSKIPDDQAARARALRWSGGRTAQRDEMLAVEEPLEIRLGGRRFTLTMRTPGHDEELVAGFLFAEGFVACAHELGEIRRVRDRAGKPEPNIIDVILRVPAEALRARLKRNFAITSSCGICGKTSIESLIRRIAAPHGTVRVAPRTILGLQSAMRAEQAIFAATGGLHAAALFDRSGNLSALREDVGRHNAMDKLIGWALGAGLVPLSNSIMMVSGRLSFELVQKAAAAGVPIVAAVSAPSSLAVELAMEIGTTLVGFLRAASFNVYTHPERIAE
jgi:FdhD protein